MLFCFAPPPRAAYRNRRRGFNLIEAAVVLGVIGVVVGTIWGVSAHFYEEYKVNKTAEGILEIVRNTQNLVSASDAEKILVPITPSLIKANVFPADWVQGNAVIHPFDGGTLIMNKSTDFAVRLYDVPPSACVKLTVRLSSIGAMMGSLGDGPYARSSLGYIASGGSGSTLYLSNFPVSFTTARPFCGNMKGVMEFGYNYTRIN